MSAKAWGPGDRTAVEMFVRDDAVSLCLLVNRRARTMRVVDFRAGPSPAKKSRVLSLAAREQIEKVYTLVERDEVATWGKLGFAKEGSIPGFYKRSDAFLLGYSMSAEEVPARSEVRIAVGDHLVRDDASTEAQHHAERTFARAKRFARDLAPRPVPSSKLAPMAEEEARRAVAAAVRSQRALTAFEPFGRDVSRSYGVATARGFELVVSTERQSCFGNVLLELLTAPRNDTERATTFAVVRSVCDGLLADGVVSCFAMTPVDDAGLAAAFVVNGFRRTGLLENHIVVGAERKDAILWSRKLANPSDG